ncbi:MAG: dTDP-4-dehydrorhamnose reductase [Mucilaginibacter sp.]|nr:dTDP-4-dehydrorhamnose reductase [Mucilaginibacter sp.]
MKQVSATNIEIWGGIECTINRVGDEYFDQLEYAGHYLRDEDIGLFASLGVKKIRYPVLWERHQPNQHTPINWSATAKRLRLLRSKNIDVIAGLVHHGSGPAFVNMADETFVQGLANYAAEVAERFPWIDYYTPVNEPLTTARFCGLYGIWHPHHNNDRSFCRILLNECRATILAMQAIRKINPNAKLVQTEDLGKIHSTPLLQYQADFENYRRWLAFDLLCGKVNSLHALWQYLLDSGVEPAELDFFIENKCEPDIMGLNHYLTSERYLDENIDNYPEHTHGGNLRHRYADVEAVRVGHINPDGPYSLLTEVWERYSLPIAVTEVHLHCTREEQMRWLSTLWQTAEDLKNSGVAIKAITPWAFLGAFGWNRLLTVPNGNYEPGVFDLSTGQPRATALAKMISSYSSNHSYAHPLISSRGWWNRDTRVIYGTDEFRNPDIIDRNNQPLLIIGKSGTLGSAFAKICGARGIHYEILGRPELDITSLPQIEKIILEKNPWAIVNTAGYVRVDDAEMESGSCFALNTDGAANLAALCDKYGIKLLTFSTDLVFNGHKSQPYMEKDGKNPLNVYGQSKAFAEEKVMQCNSRALIIRTSAFFGPWDSYNFIAVALNSLKQGNSFTAVNDVVVSPTYVPDLVNTSLDLMIDDETGIWHLSNKGQISWSDLAFAIAERGGHSTNLVQPQPLSQFKFRAKRPLYSVLSSQRGNILPTLDDALNRYFSEAG